METYGAAFSALYDARWDLWARSAWPIMAPHLPRAGTGPRRWLDLCCGSGLLLRLAGAEGFEATGIDRSPHQLGHAARKAPGARLIESDILDLALPDRFDVITCMFDSLNYLLRLGDLDRALAVARRHLAPGGVVIFDVKTTAGFRYERPKVYREPHQVTVFESAFDEARERHTFTITGFVADGDRYRRFDEIHIQRPHDGAVVAARLRLAGLTGRAIDFATGGKMRANSRRLLYVCRALGARSARTGEARPRRDRGTGNG